MIEVISTQAKSTCKCLRCRSEMTYNYTDVVEFKVNIDYLGDYDTVKGIRCPVCDSVIVT